MAKSKRDELATLITLSGLPKADCEKALNAVPSHSAGAALMLMLKKKQIDPVELSDNAVTEIKNRLSQNSASLLGNMFSSILKHADDPDIGGEDDIELNLLQMDDPTLTTRILQGREAANQLSEVFANEEKKEKKARGLPPVVCAGITLKFKDERWTGTTILQAWSKFGDRENVEVEVDVEAPMDETQNWLPPTPSQLAALKDFIDNQDAMNEVICTGIKDCVRQMRESGWGETPDPKTVIPYEVYSPSLLHVIAVARDGRSYVGVGGHCEFEEEHGVGLMLHNRRVVDFGYSEQATDCWIALEDGGKHEGFVPENDEEER